jgi:cell division protein FtsZ
MFELIDEVTNIEANIKVVGVGGGGGNAVKHMISSNVTGVEFICANTDVQVLENGDAISLRLGGSLTKGLGAGANPEVGRQAAIEDREKIKEVLVGADMVFITAGMGGGTGTGAAPVIADVAREMGALTVAVVTKPFNFEGKKRMQQAESGMKELKESVDSLITIPNEKLMQVMGAKSSFLEAFNAANDVLLHAVQGIADLIIKPGLINLDFADVCTVMTEMGTAMMGTGMAQGENRAREAAEAAIHSPLLEDVSLAGAKGILVNVTAGMDFGLGEFDEVGKIIHEFAADDASVVVGMVLDPEMSEDIKVTVVATGLTTSNTTSQIGHNKVNPKDAIANARRARRENDQNAEKGREEYEATRVHTVNSDQNTEKNANFLDLPTFLRRQVD